MSGQVGTEPLVLLPGLSTDARLFRDQITVLSRRFPVMVGAPVQGERVEEIASALLGMLPARSALFGYGFGGVIALELMRRAPERFTRIALMATTPLAGTPHEAAELETRIVAARTGRLADAISSEYPVTSLGSGIGRARVTDVIQEMARDLGPEVYLRQARAHQRRKDQQPVLRRIRQPALVLCGAHDTVTPIKRHEFMAEMIPYAEFRVFDNAGHVPTLEVPDEVTETIGDWMRQPLVLR